MIVKYPIYDKQKNIRCYTLIDSQDLSRISKYSWSLMGRNYIKARINGKDIYLHRFLMKEKNPQIIVDHINRDRLDNRKTNLRLANRSENAFNRKKISNTSSRYKGVSFDKAKGLWQAYIKMNGIKYLLGYFKNEKKAAQTYDQFASYYYGEFVAPNFKK